MNEDFVHCLLCKKKVKTNHFMKHRKELHGSATKKQLKVIEQTNSTCNLCSKVFATQKYLMKTHQPKDPKSKLSCNVCLLKKNGVSITNKAYIVFEHLILVIEQKKQGLGEWSEEVVEACHQKFDEIWRNYTVKNPHSEKHGDNFYRAVLHFNAYNA